MNIKFHGDIQQEQLVIETSLGRATVSVDFSGNLVIEGESVLSSVGLTVEEAKARFLESAAKPATKARYSNSQLDPSTAESTAPPLDALTRLPFIGLQGTIYRCPMPYGYYDPEGQGLAAMKQNKVDAVVMLASDQEARKNTGRDLRMLYAANGLQVLHFPIPDFGVPERAALEQVVEQVIDLAQQGKHITVHCLGGIGRTGLFMAEVAKKSMGMTGSSALDWVRLTIKGAVETEEQERFVLEQLD